MGCPIDRGRTLSLMKINSPGCWSTKLSFLGRLLLSFYGFVPVSYHYFGITIWLHKLEAEKNVTIMLMEFNIMNSYAHKNSKASDREKAKFS